MSRSKRILDLVNQGVLQEKVPVTVTGIQICSRQKRKRNESPLPEEFHEELIQLQDLLGDVFSENLVEDNISDAQDSYCQEILTQAAPEITKTAKFESPDSFNKNNLTQNIYNKSFKITQSFSSSTTDDKRNTRSNDKLKQIYTNPIQSPIPLHDKISNNEHITQNDDTLKEARALFMQSPTTLHNEEGDDEQHTQIDETHTTPMPSPIQIHKENCEIQFCASCVENFVLQDIYENINTPSEYDFLSNIPTPSSTTSLRKKTYKTDKGKKRLVHKDRWVTVQRKQKKNTGQEFVNKKGKVIEKKQLKDPCSEKCRLKCREKITHEDRLRIFNYFWQLGYKQRHWEFVIKYTKKCPKRRQTTEITKHNRQNTFQYFLLDAEKKAVKVCKTMFLNTISLSERVVTTAWKKYDGNTVIEEDKRGHYVHNKRVYNDEMIRSVFDHYREIVYQNFNLALHRPKKDKCDVCHAFENKSAPTDEERNVFAKHLARKRRARELKKADKNDAAANNKVVAATFDFQKVLVTPYGDVSVLYYKRRLATLNFTVFDLASKIGTCYMWHDGIAKRGSIEVSSCLLNFIKHYVEKGVTDFRFWSDNCSGQNRNRIVFSLYLFAAKTFGVTVTHRFLEKGHTQNEGDSVHATVERSCRHKTIWVPEEWYCLARWAKSEGDPYIIKEMKQEEIFDFKAFLANKNWTKNTANEKVTWTSVREVKVTAQQYDRIEYKYDLNDEPSTIIVIRASTRNKKRLATEFELFRAYDAPLPINKDKYRDLTDLCRAGIVPDRYHSFYFSLSHTVNANINNEDVDSD
ncbi:hypothetical protein ACJJTC_003953 [Scirpophaga incertulas]